MGYDGVQLSAVGCMSGETPSVDAATARKWCDEYGLVCCATHRAWERLANHLEEEILFHKTLGCDYLATGSIQGDFGELPDSYRRYLEAASPIAARLAEVGIRFGYHNHSHEFVRDPETGRPCFERLLDAKWLQLEIDTYWIAHAGANPGRVLRRAAGRIAAVHLKDMEVVLGEGPVMAPVGEGNLDWPDILAACQEGGTEWLIVEQDVCRRDPFDCLEASCKWVGGAVGR
jgi:sugar phosphate isomerase/epimerase